MSADHAQPADQVHKYVELAKDKIHDTLKKFPQVDEKVDMLAKKVNVDKAYVAGGIMLIPFLLLLSFGSGNFVVDCIGFLYPVYASVKAIESDNKTDDSFWLTYWLIFALFKVMEGAADRILSMIPYYFFIKCAFLVWCFHSKTKGALIIYNHAVKVYLVPLVHEEGEVEKKND